MTPTPTTPPSSPGCALLSAIRMFTSSLPVPVLVAAPDCGPWGNGAFERLAAPGDEETSASWEGVVHPADLPRLHAALEATALPAPAWCHVRIRDGTAGWRDGWIHAVPVPGVPGAVMASVLDACEIGASDVLQLGRVFELASEALVVLSLDGVVRRANPAFVEVFGTVPTRQVNFLDALEPQDREYLEALWGRVIQGESVRFSFSTPALSGRKIFEWLAVPDLTRRLVYASGRDITAHLTAESEHEALMAARARLAGLSREALEAAEGRVVTLALFARAVAHEVNNPLQALSLSLSSLDGRLTALGVADHALVESLADARAAIEHVAETARCMRRLGGGPVAPLDARRTAAGPGVVRGAPCDFAETISVAARLARVRALPGVRVVVGLPATLPVAPAPDGLVLVLLNLVNNAARAVAETGRPGDVEVTSEALGGWLRVQVTDHGTGIAPEDLPRVWAPGFSTHGHQGGAGIGLWLSRLLVERAGGHIDVSSVLGTGSTFTVRLPLEPDHVARRLATVRSMASS